MVVLFISKMGCEKGFSNLWYTQKLLAVTGMQILANKVIRDYLDFIHKYFGLDI